MTPRRLARAALAWTYTISAPFLAALTLLSPQAASAPCDEAAPTVSISAAFPEPVIDGSLEQAALQRLSEQLSPGLHGGATQGLYYAELHLSAQLRARSKNTAEGACVWIDEVRLTLSMPVRRIYISSQWKPGTCAYTAVLEHERKHQATDEQAISERRPFIIRQIEAAVVREGPETVAPADRQQIPARLSQAVGTAIERALQEAVANRRRLQLQVDAGLEYSRVFASCSQFH